MQRLLKGGEGMTSVPICSQSICNSPSSITGGNIRGERLGISHRKRSKAIFICISIAFRLFWVAMAWLEWGISWDSGISRQGYPKIVEILLIGATEGKSGLKNATLYFSWRGWRWLWCTFSFKGLNLRRDLELHHVVTTILIPSYSFSWRKVKYQEIWTHFYKAFFFADHFIKCIKRWAI